MWARNGKVSHHERSKMSKLNETQIKTLKPKEKPYELSDGDGLFLHINTNGSKGWRCRFKFEGREQLMGLGAYPDVTIADARSKLVECRNKVVNGMNRIEDRKEIRK